MIYQELILVICHNEKHIHQIGVGLGENKSEACRGLRSLDSPDGPVPIGDFDGLSFDSTVTISSSSSFVCL